MKRRTLSLAALALPLMLTAQNPPLMGWSSWNTYGYQINDSVLKAQADDTVYTLQGQRISAPLHTLPQGVYIVGGKKVTK